MCAVHQWHQASTLPPTYEAGKPNEFNGVWRSKGCVALPPTVCGAAKVMRRRLFGQPTGSGPPAPRHPKALAPRALGFAGCCVAQLCHQGGRSPRTRSAVLGGEGVYTLRARSAPPQNQCNPGETNVAGSTSNAGVTQLVEYPFCNRVVEGSNPFAGTGDVAQDCNSLDSGLRSSSVRV